MREGRAEAYILIKAAPQVGQRHGETVCCAGVTPEREWVRLYPVAFRHLEEAQQFGRWDRVQFKWRKPDDDSRVESRRVDHQSFKVIGELKKSEREKFLSPLLVTSLDAERAAGRSLALLKADHLRFSYGATSKDKIEAQREKFQQLHNQQDLFNTKPLIPIEPCPYTFKYAYKTDDGEREGTCQDWEIEATFFKWRRRYGEERALKDMQKRFGEEYPERGMVLAMGTHSRWPDTWLINGIMRLDEFAQMSLL